MSIVEVNADCISKTTIYIRCPLCRSSYYKNGNPRWNASIKGHLFGSNGNLSNRVEYRVSHCDQEVGGSSNLKIIIDNNTKRI